VELQVKTMCALHNFLRTTNDAFYNDSIDSVSAGNFWRTHPMAQIIKIISEGQNQALLPVKSTLEKLKVSIKPPNNVYMTRTQNLVELVKVSSSSEETPDKKNKKYICREFLSVQPFFKVPCNSKLVHIYHVENAATCLATILDADLLVKCYNVTRQEHYSSFNLRRLTSCIKACIGKSLDDVVWYVAYIVYTLYILLYTINTHAYYLYHLCPSI